MSLYLKPEHIERAEKLVGKAHANGGLAPLDLDRFRADQEAARKAPFGVDIPQVPLGIGMNYLCVFDELGIEEDAVRYRDDKEWALSLHKAYNDKAERIVGRRLLSEAPPEPASRRWPGTRQLHDVFEARREWHSGSWWLMRSAHNEDELARLLDRVEERIASMREFILPENWDREKERLTGLGVKPPLYRGQRGPITFAASVYGPEDLIFLIQDNPKLAKRFSDAILKAILAIAQVLDEEAGHTPETAPHGWSWADDNCCLLNPEMYELFGFPIMKGVFDRYCPNPGDGRHQHSDSSMEHIVPILGRLKLTGVNFGPTVTVRHIREHLPNAVIHGQLAPFTFSRNEEVNLVAEFLRDFEMAREKRGLLFGTAGSINNGSRLTGLRLIMAAIQEYGRYDA